MIIRLANLPDLPKIFEIEIEEFGPVGEGAAASSELLAQRIELLNANPPGWFWVAENEDGVVVGDLILQPTDLGPDECTSWNVSTDNGTLRATFHLGGKNIFAVSLAIGSHAPPGTADRLVRHSLVLRQERNMNYYMFCSRMPGYGEAAAKRNMTPEEYWQATRRDGSPLDGMLREYTDMFGEGPARLLLNGWPVDKASGGHGVLFAVSKPDLNLACIEMRIRRAEKAQAHKDKKKKRRSNERKNCP